MDCKQCAEDLTAFLDGELSAADSQEVRSHLDSCLSCSEELSSLRETADFVESHNRKLELRPGAWNLVKARIMTEAAPPRSWVPNRLRFAMAALAIAAAFGLGYLQYQHIQAQHLDTYISTYIEQRKAQMKVSHSLSDGAQLMPAVENLYADNPFVEIKAAIAGNPFRSEE